MFYVVNKHRYLLLCAEINSGCYGNFFRQYLSTNPTVLQPVVYCYMNLLISQMQVAEMASFVDEETEFLLTMIHSNVTTIFDNTDSC